MIDLTEITPVKKFSRPVSPARPVQKTDITPKTLSQDKDPEVASIEKMEKRRREAVGRETYDITDFGALETDRGFISDAGVAEEIHEERKSAGEFEGDEDESID